MLPHNGSSVSKGRANSAITQIIRFAIVGVCSTGIYVASTLLLHRYALLQVPAAASVSFAIVVAINYVAHYCWTFKSNCPHSVAVLRFLGTAAGGWIINSIVVALGTHWTGARPTTILLVGAASVVIWNYSLSKFWVFVDRRPGN